MFAMPLAEPPDGLLALLNISKRYKHLGHFLRVDALADASSPLRHGDAGAAVQFASARVPRVHGPEADDVRHEGVGRPEPVRQIGRGRFVVAEDGGPRSGILGRLRPGVRAARLAFPRGQG